jgi:DNA-binding NarL/FixJ family response regulator
MERCALRMQRSITGNDQSKLIFHQWNVMRVLLAGGQAKVRWALHFFLKEQPGLIPVGETSEVETLLNQVTTTGADVVLLDWELPGYAPAELLAKLHQMNQRLWVVILSDHPDVRPAALAAGADAFICKNDPPQVLLAALQSMD